MKKFKPLAMKCSQKDWDSIKGRIPKKKINSVCNFEKYDYLTITEMGKVSNINRKGFEFIWDDLEEIHETFNAKIFLNACGIDCDVYEITKEQVLRIAERGISESKLRQWFPDAFKKELEVGKWYTPCNGYEGTALLYYENHENKHSCGYGFNFKGEWAQTYSIILSDHVTYREATPQEVESALICEWEKNNDKFHRYELLCNYTLIGWNKNEECSELFKNGKWSITIQEAEKLLNKKIV